MSPVRIPFYAIAESNGLRFGYRKLKSSHIPKGWSNDPRQLETISDSSFGGYNLYPPTLPVLVSEATATPRRYLVSNFGHFYFWIPSTSELLYITECYNLEGILQRIDDGDYELQTKSLEPLTTQYNQHQITHLCLWFWQVPRGWSQDVQELKDLKEIISGQEYGLPLPVPVLTSDESDEAEGTEFLMKCGDDFYLFDDLSHDLLHVDEPSELHGILFVLDKGDSEDLKTTLVNCLPEYGGPNIVADNNVPIGWSNKIDKEVCCADVFYEHGIMGSDLLIFCHGSPNDNAKYMVEAESGHYFWDTISNEVFRIDKAQGLQDILDIIKNPCRQLNVSRVSTVHRPKVPPRVVEEGGQAIQRSRQGNDHRWFP